MRALGLYPTEVPLSKGTLLWLVSEKKDYTKDSWKFRGNSKKQGGFLIRPVSIKYLSKKLEKGIDTLTN